ncbi:MAG: MATE family efflux transporter [Clostridiales bacterium]|nr:MATE family efflux transporter [Clostridiales bacterium]
MGKIFVRDKQFYRQTAAVAVPVALQSAITVGVNMTDNVMLGSLGEIQMSGATLANQYISIFQICCMGLGMGASVLTSRYFGMKDRNSLKKAVVLMLRLMLAVAAGFFVATLFVSRGIMSIFTEEADVIAAGTNYLHISLPTFFLLGFSLTISLVLRSVGRANIPLISSIFAFFINVFFNWMFIYGNLGAPRMEVRGAALGTLIAQAFEFLFIAGFFFFREKVVHMRLRDLFLPCGDLLPEYVRVGMPVLVSDTLLGLGNSAVAVVMGHIGAVFVAANAITTVTQQMVTVVTQGISQASCVVTGNTLGEGEAKQAQRQGVTYAALGLLIGVIGSVIILLISRSIVNIYNVSSETKELAYELMHALAITVIFQCLNSILTKGVLRGGGDTRFLMVADILFLWCASIPLGAMAGLVWHWSGGYIYIALKIDQFIKAMLCLWRLHSGKWIKKIRQAG